jgi:hypothetical protein
MKEIMEYNAGETIEAWYIDPKAGKQPQVQTEDYYIRGKRLIDLYRESSEPYGVFWRLGSPKLEGMSRMDRLAYTQAYLDPLDNVHPMMWFHDKPEMTPLKEEFRRYRLAISSDPTKNAPDTTHDADNHAIYCVEGACIMPIRYYPNTIQPQTPIDSYKEVNKFMSEPFSEGQFDDSQRL